LERRCYNGERLKSRVDLPFVGTAIAQSPTSSLAIVTGSERVAFVGLDSGEVFEQFAANLSPPAAMVSRSPERACPSRHTG